MANKHLMQLAECNCVYSVKWKKNTAVICIIKNNLRLCRDYYIELIKRQSLIYELYKLFHILQIPLNNFLSFITFLQMLH